MVPDKGYLEGSQTSMMKYSCKNSEGLKAAKCLHKKNYIIDVEWVLNAPVIDCDVFLTRKKCVIAEGYYCCFRVLLRHGDIMTQLIVSKLQF